MSNISNKPQSLGLIIFLFSTFQHSNIYNINIMNVMRQRLHSTHKVEISGCCSVVSSMANQKMKVSLSDSFSAHSQTTALTEACSVDSSSFASFSGESRTVTTAALSATATTSINSVLKRNQISRLAKDVRITFAHDVVQRSILGRHQYSNDELDACWFRGDEYTAITRSCIKQIQKLEQGAKLRDQKYCSRGLEAHTKLAGLAKAQNRRAAWDGVLDEEEEQISLGVVDDEPIARSYQDVSSSCQLWARKVALDDQRAAELVYDEMLDEQ
jgi:hypothetical protein